MMCIDEQLCKKVEKMNIVEIKELEAVRKLNKIEQQCAEIKYKIGVNNLNINELKICDDGKLKTRKILISMIFHKTQIASVSEVVSVLPTRDSG